MDNMAIFDDNLCGGGSINYMSVDGETITGIGLLEGITFRKEPCIRIWVMKLEIMFYLE